MSEKDKEPEDWLDDLSKLSVGGISVPSAPGLRVWFYLADLSEKPDEAMEKYKNKKNRKFYWKIHLEKIDWFKDSYREVLETEKPEKLEYIDEFEVERDLILKLSPTATKQFAKFIKDNKITEEDLLKYMFTGSGRDTVYHFRKVKE